MIFIKEYINNINIKFIRRKKDDCPCSFDSIEVYINGKVIPNLKRFAIDLDVESSDLSPLYTLEQYMDPPDV